MRETDSEPAVSPNNQERQPGSIVRIAGPVVAAEHLPSPRLYDVVRVGHPGLIGEIIQLNGNVTTVQVYEDTIGLQIGEPVTNVGQPLSVRLGPGLLGRVYDGLQRPLVTLAADGAFLARGTAAAALDQTRRWPFTPTVTEGQSVTAGDLLGTVPETANIEHRLLTPPGVSGRVELVKNGRFTIEAPVVVIDTGAGDTHTVQLSHHWPVRRPRPVSERLQPNTPLITGTRVIDTFFPVAKGGTAIIPGGFGTGKTVTEQTLARWADVDVVVYIGCGERGNEMAEVLADFPELEDPRYGTPLMERTILIANTSNMPVAAREASVYTGITLAEYYRDMGYDVLLLADSTSRWGEALREISGRLEEMPGEEGYPAYLATRLAEFYERAGRVTHPQNHNTDARTGSVTIIGAVSPPGGDFSEPMTQSSLRVAGTFWALDYDLSRRRHFPAINWLQSYTLYALKSWYADQVSPEWPALVQQAIDILQREEELQEIVQLVGPDTLANDQRLLLAAARLLREDYLQQFATHPVDRYCALPKMAWMLRVILAFYEAAQRALAAGVELASILSWPSVGQIARMKEWEEETAVERLQALHNEIKAYDPITNSD